VYVFSDQLTINDVDPVSYERHLVEFGKERVLTRNCIHKLQARFSELGFGYMVGNVNGCFNKRLISAVLSFQEQALSPRRRIIDLYSEVENVTEVSVTFKGQVSGDFDKYTADELNIWLEN